MYKPVKAIEVRIRGKRVGGLAYEPGLARYVFECDPAFVRTGIELAPFNMPLSMSSSPFVFPDLPDLSFQRLPGMIADKFRVEAVDQICYYYVEGHSS